jgi:hypothetical protein
LVEVEVAIVLIAECSQLIFTALPFSRYFQELLLSYNVGIHVDDREKNMKHRAAALVGLALPPDPEPYVK